MHNSNGVKTLHVVHFRLNCVVDLVKYSILVEITLLATHAI